MMKKKTKKKKTQLNYARKSELKSADFFKAVGLYACDILVRTKQPFCFFYNLVYLFPFCTEVRIIFYSLEEIVCFLNFQVFVFAVFQMYIERICYLLNENLEGGGMSPSL